MTASPAVESHALRLEPDTGAPDLHELHALLDGNRNGNAEQAWDRFVARYSRLLLHIAGLVMPDHDGVMDGYAHVLEQLRRDDFYVLRTYRRTDQCKFSTWLAVVARRTCVDFHRQRFGRPRPSGSSKVDAERASRQRLINLVGVATDLTQLADRNSVTPDRSLRESELHEAVAAALAMLTPADRLLLKLRFDDDLPAQAIATVLGLPSPFHVYRRINAVCADLRHHLLERGIMDSSP